MSLRIEPVTEFGEFTTSLRNIRATLDEARLILDLIPGRLGAEWAPGPEEPDYMKKLLGGSGREIVEADRFLRLEFDQIWGWMIHEEFSENVAFDIPSDLYPRIPGEKGHYPICRIVGSPWREAVPEHQGGDSEDLVHFRIVSMTTYMDVISWMPEGRWQERGKS